MRTADHSTYRCSRTVHVSFPSHGSSRYDIYERSETASRIRSASISLFFITFWMPSWLRLSQCMPAVTTTLVSNAAARTSETAFAS